MAVIKDTFNNTPDVTASGKYVITSTAGEL
jgi:hypothetical protein